MKEYGVNMSSYRGMSSKDKTACFFCDFWWLILLLIMLLILGYLAYNYFLQPVFRPLQSTLPDNVSLGTGDIQITLRWEGLNDLDLHVVDPFGEEISYMDTTSNSGGRLDVDANAGCTGNVTQNGVENIFWPVNIAPSGEYKIFVVKYDHCPVSETRTPFTLEVLVDGIVTTFDGEVSRSGQEVLVHTFSR